MNRSLRQAAAARRPKPSFKLTKVVRGEEDAPTPLGQGEGYGHDYSSYGVNPMAPRPMLSELPPGEPEYEQHDDLSLITKKKGKSLVVDPDQHYIVITLTGKDWWDGTQQDLGAIGREKALRAFDRS
jgi:hypothetical protein